MTVVSARRFAVGVALSAALAGLAAAPASGSVAGHNTQANTSESGEKAAAEHVLLISVDGLHQSDLAWYVAKNPTSNLAKLAANGVDYSNASTPFPSDSYPGIVGQVTGGNPSSTGVSYDDSWNSSLFPPGTTNCSGKAPGSEVPFMEAIAKNPNALDSGQGIVPAAPAPNTDPWANILKLTSNPKDLIDTSKLPVDPKTCQPIYPDQYLKVNTVFEVAKQHQLLTAWSDKHAAYQIVAGPSGTGVDDFFTPEINSSANPLHPTETGQDDWTKDNLNTQKYDGYKVQAVLNWIAGQKHDGTGNAGTPAIFGMNFQSVSTAQKLPTSNTNGNPIVQGAKGGYMADGFTPEKVLSNALDYVDRSLGMMVDALKARNLYDKTAIIISAKHGQSPMNPAALNRIDDGKIIDALNAAWKKDHPGADLVAFSINDDGMLIWLSDHSQAAADFAKAFLQKYNDSTASVDGKPVTSAGLTQIYAGAEAANVFNVEVGDPRVPDVVGIAQYGVVFTSKKAKISEHGGDNPHDRNVPILISGKSLPHNANVTKPVETTQIAPTILQLLGLNPEELKAVRMEGTDSLLG